MPSIDSLKTRRDLAVGDKSYVYYSLKAAEEAGLSGISTLPVSLKVLLENLLRYEGDAVDAGDLEAALAHLDRLPPAGADALSGWRSQASRRIEIDRRVADIRAAAVRDLVATKSANP